MSGRVSAYASYSAHPAAPVCRMAAASVSRVTKSAAAAPGRLAVVVRQTTRPPCGATAADPALALWRHVRSCTTACRASVHARGVKCGGDEEGQGEEGVIFRFSSGGPGPSPPAKAVARQRRRRLPTSQALLEPQSPVLTTRCVGRMAAMGLDSACVRQQQQHTAQRRP